jgi:hypothetical protein
MQAKRQAEMFADDLSDLTWTKINTMKGDIRDSVLDWFKSKKKSWGDQDGFGQSQTIKDIETLAGDMVRNVARLVATRGFDHMTITLSKATIDREKSVITTTFSLPRTVDNILFMNECLDTQVQVVPTPVAEFMGEKAPAVSDVIGTLKIPNPEVKNAKPEEVVADATTKPAADVPHDPETGELPPEPPAAEVRQ